MNPVLYALWSSLSNPMLRNVESLKTRPGPSPRRSRSPIPAATSSFDTAGYITKDVKAFGTQLQSTTTITRDAVSDLPSAVVDPLRHARRRIFRSVLFQPDLSAPVPCHTNRSEVPRTSLTTPAASSVGWRYRKTPIRRRAADRGAAQRGGRPRRRLRTVNGGNRPEAAVRGGGDCDPSKLGRNPGVTRDGH